MQILAEQVRRRNWVLVLVPMVNVRIVRMSVLEWFVNVGVRMRFLPVPVRIVLMLMMRVVNMRMLVVQR